MPSLVWQLVGPSVGPSCREPVRGHNVVIHAQEWSVWQWPGATGDIRNPLNKIEATKMQGGEQVGGEFNKCASFATAMFRF